MVDKNRSTLIHNKIKMKRLLIVIMLPFILEACQKEAPAQADDMCILRISPFIVSADVEKSSADAEPTRTAIANVISLVGSPAGISILKADAYPYVAYELPGYSNIKALLRSANINAPPYYQVKWEFTPAGSSSFTPSLGVFKNRGGLDFYAYYPYNENVNETNIDAIPFTVGTTDATNIDYMRSKILDINPTQSEVAITPVFDHVMTMLNFNVGTSYLGPMKLNYIKLEASDDIFVMKGTYSAVNGKVTPNLSSKTNTLKIEYNKVVPMYAEEQTNPPFQFAMMIPEIIVDDACLTTMTVTFNFDTDMQLIEGGGSYTLNLRDIVTNDGRRGFVQGYQYVFTVKIDNYIKYSGYPVINKDWSTADTTKIII